MNFILPQRPKSPFQKRMDDLARDIVKVRHIYEGKILHDAITAYCGGMPSLVLCGYMAHITIHPDGRKDLSWGRRDNVIAHIPPFRLTGGVR